MAGGRPSPRPRWEKFLNRYGVILDSPVRWADIPDGYLPVVVHGMYGTEASVCRSKAEYDAIVGPARKPNPRRTVYLVETEDIGTHWPAERPKRTAIKKDVPRSGKKATRREERA